MTLIEYADEIDNEIIRKREEFADKLAVLN